MWKIKNKEAVSPVIGVILMVTITVVLATVLYVWVAGTGTEKYEPPKPTTGTLEFAVYNVGYHDQWVRFYIDDVQVARKYVKVDDGAWSIHSRYEFGTYKLSTYAEYSGDSGYKYMTISEDNTRATVYWDFY
ncbi:MAG: type IV pilin [Thermoplasmatales archaeon]|nr:type IV pilin [Thermoplasmatales archaeon]